VHINFNEHLVDSFISSNETFPTEYCNVLIRYKSYTLTNTKPFITR